MNRLPTHPIIVDANGNRGHAFFLANDVAHLFPTRTPETPRASLKLGHVSAKDRLRLSHRWRATSVVANTKWNPRRCYHVPHASCFLQSGRDWFLSENRFPCGNGGLVNRNTEMLRGRHNQQVHFWVVHSGTKIR